jgi:hypothetical protein
MPEWLYALLYNLGWSQGWDAYKRGVPMEFNPYGVEYYAEYAGWKDGWWHGWDVDCPAE